MAKFGRGVLAAVCVLGFLGSPAPTVHGQTWKHLLKSAAQNAVDEQVGGEAGRIRRLRVIRRAPSEVTVEVHLTGVEDPQAVHLEAELLDNRGEPIQPVVTKHEPIPQGDGVVKATVRYTGQGTVWSSILLLKLVTSGGTVSSRRTTMVAREWQGTGQGPAAQSAAAAPTPTPAPRVVRLQPVPVGDTPTGASAMGLGGLRLIPATRHPEVPGPSPTPTPKAAAVMQVPPAVMARGVAVKKTLVDLYRAAFRGSWSNGSVKLPFNGPANDRRGFVRALGQHKLNDGMTYQRVLQTHPAWKAHGMIVGEITVHLPAKARRIESTVGFLPGAGSPDGVTAQIFVRRPGTRSVRLWSRRITPGDGPVPLSVKLPAGFAGQRATIKVRVLAGASSAQDWFAWSGLRVTD